MSTLDYVDHYTKYLDVYREMAYCNDGKTVWIPTDDHDGWYVSSNVTDEDTKAWEEGYPKKSRPSILPDDLDPNVDRTAYTTISYAPDSAYETAYYRTTGDGIEWMEDIDRLPDYGELSAWALFVDIDIDKDYKQRPLPPEHKDIIEQRLELWTKAFAEMAGSIQNVMLLDSGGGMYVFVPPSALSPVSERYDEEDLQYIFNEIGKRMRTVTGELNDLICDQDEGPKELFSADKVQNKNRQFKTIGAIHKDLDAVVYPIDPQDISIKHMRVEDVEKENIESASNWANKFTNNKHEECVSYVIEYLFQGDFTQRDDMEIEYVDGNGWKEILDNWIESKKESIKEWEANREKRQNISKKQLKTDITQDRDVAREAIRRVNNQKLKEYIIDFLGSDKVYDKGNEEMDFFPFWRSESTESGRSAFYDYYEGKARFTDKADGTSRDIVYWVALEMTYDDENYPDTNLIDSPGESLEGKDYRIALEELRNRGEDIPILVPEVDDEDSLSDWRIKQMAIDLGLADHSEDIIVDHNGDEKLRPEAWNRTLERLEYDDITHNRNKKEPLTIEDITPPVTPEKQEQAQRNQIRDQFFNDFGHYKPEFDSRENYKNFIDELPQYVIPFVYEGEINGSETGNVLCGVFTEQDEQTLTMVRFEPFPVESVGAISSYQDLPIQTDETLSKEKLEILIKPK